MVRINSSRAIPGQDGDYTAECLFDYDFIKNHFRLKAFY